MVAACHLSLRSMLTRAWIDQDQWPIATVLAGMHLFPARRARVCCIVR